MFDSKGGVGKCAVAGQKRRRVKVITERSGSKISNAIRGTSGRAIGRVGEYTWGLVVEERGVQRGAAPLGLGGGG